MSVQHCTRHFCIIVPVSDALATNQPLLNCSVCFPHSNDTFRGVWSLTLIRFVKTFHRNIPIKNSITLFYQLASCLAICGAPQSCNSVKQIRTPYHYALFAKHDLDPNWHWHNPTLGSIFSWWIQADFCRLKLNLSYLKLCHLCLLFFQSQLWTYNLGPWSWAPRSKLYDTAQVKNNFGSVIVEN